MGKKNKNYDIREIFDQMELDLISSMHRAFYFHKKEQIREGFNWEQWQKSKLRAIEEYRKRNRKILKSYKRPIQKTINRELKSNYILGKNKFVSAAKRLIDKFKHIKDVIRGTYKGDISIPKDISDIGFGNPPAEKDFFGMNDKKLEALQKSVKADIKKANSSILRKMDDVYRQTIYKSHVYLQSGAVTLNKAIDMATKDFLNKGIDNIVYSNGAHVNIASYAEMCLRTANHRAMLLGEGSKRDEWNIHLVVVSAHANTCPLCEPWQGKVLIDDVFSHPNEEYINKYIGKYKLLSEAIKAGLLHCNCRHALSTYFEGVTTLPKVLDRKEAIMLYKEEQKQRAIERKIRKQKRIVTGTCDEDSLRLETKKLKDLEKQIRGHLKNNPELRRNKEREKADFRSIQDINYTEDLKQYEKYKEVLDKEAPETFDKFHELKYNNSKEWSIKQREYSTINAINNKDWSDVYKEKVKNIYYDFRGDNIELSCHGAQRFIQRSVDRNGNIIFTKEDIVRMFNEKPNYIQEDGRLVNFNNGIAVIRNENTNEIVSIVVRKNPKAGWKIND